MEAAAAPKAKAPQETRTFYVCPNGAAHRGYLWRGPGLKRHRERCPKCPYEPFGVSYKTVDLEAHLEAADDEAEARHAFFAERAQQADAERRAGSGRAVALKRAIDGGHLVWIVVPPQAQPGDFFAHRGVKDHPLKRTVDDRYVESKEEDVWEQEPGARSDAATPACPIGPVPDPRPVCMPITVWARGLRPSEAVLAAAKGAEAAAAAEAKAAEAAEEEAGWAEQEALAFDEGDDDDADDGTDDDEEGEAEEGEGEEGEAEVAPTAAAPTEPAEPAATPAASAAPDTAIAVPVAAPTAPIAVAAPAAAPVSAASDANARIEAAVAAKLAEAIQGGMSVAVARRTVRCFRA